MDESPANILKRADKKARGGTFSFLTGGPDYDEASELYAMAGNKYKLKRQFKDAAECFLKVAFMQNKVGSTMSEANAYVEAGHLLHKDDGKSGGEYLEKAVEIYNSDGRFNQSAKLMKSMAESFDEANDKVNAAIYFKKAAEYFEMDDYGKSQCTQCRLKYAELASITDSSKIPEAIKILETEGNKALRNNLMQFAAKDYFFKAGILLLSQGDSIDARIACERYEGCDPRFSSSREGKLLRQLVEAFEGSDVETFVAALREYDQITKLDHWKMTFVNRAKDILEPASERMQNFGDDEDEDPDNLDMT